MLEQFQPHNTHHEDPARFAALDPHLRRLASQPLIHRSSLLDALPRGVPGIFTLGGGRQIGKTTLLKQWIALLLEADVPPRRITYLAGELIDDHHSLVPLFRQLLESASPAGLTYVLLDEVTTIRDWDKGIKYLADAGLLDDVVLLLTGSDLVLIQEARMRLPGRRGRADVVDFHMYPLSFLEVVRLKRVVDAQGLEAVLDPSRPLDPDSVTALFASFDAYLQHGGFLTAMNDLARDNTIRPATYQTYSDWIRGDMLKRGKLERNLREILRGLIRRYMSQITWNNLAQDLSIEHPATVADYIALLESMDVVFVQHALLEDKRVAAPKKARRVMFNDPFILHALRSWLEPSADPYHDQTVPLLQDPEWTGRLADASAVTHFRRHFPTYYIKADGEVDVAYVAEDRFWPVEVKWTGQVRPRDLKQIAKYPNGLLLDRARGSREVNGVPTMPLAVALLRLEAGGGRPLRARVDG